MQAARKNTDGLNRTVFISDNLPFLRSLDTESVDLVVIDPPFGKRQTFQGTLAPPITDAELREERELMQRWGITDPASAYEIGLEYPDQTGTTATFKDIWDFKKIAYEDEMDELEQHYPAVHYLVQSTRYTHSNSLAAYIFFMAVRMIEIKRILRATGSVYLHCDHTANGYLRQMMDAVFGEGNFRNEIVWSYRTGGTSKNRWSRKHDTILFYVKSDEYQHNPLKERVMYDKPFFVSQQDEDGNYYADVYMRDVWDDIKPLINVSAERTGYPTQKPQALALRIIEASSRAGDMVLDCFAGCAYVPVAAELTGRRWFACDMSPRSWTAVRRQFHKQPTLQIRTEGEAPEEAAKIQLATDDKVIKVRGPGDFPERTTTDETPKKQLPRDIKSVPKIVYKQKPMETDDAIWQAFIAEWGADCWYCGDRKTRDRRELHLDHIQPRDGANDDCWNRALACAPCNGDKRNTLTPAETIKKAFQSERIATESLMREQQNRFQVRNDWAKERFERIKKSEL